MMATPSCAWCGGKTHRPEGVFLGLLADGRLMCDGCGLYTLSCECVERPARPTTAPRSGSSLARMNGRTATAPDKVAMDPWLARRILAGWRPEAVANAGGISVRSAKRWRKDLVDVATVELGGYAATFAVRDGKAPIRLDDWRRV